MNNNKTRLLLCAVLIPAILVSIIFISKLFGARLIVDEPTRSPLPGVNLNTLFENDKQNALAVKKTNTKSLVGTGPEKTQLIYKLTTLRFRLSISILK
ncbi:hypothetical protein N9356_00445 [Porticoccaceae bacterium]|nr:hypothetical protein [Porticoccaceae bacterium]